jgi:nitrous oxidase accessory protein
MFSGIILTLFLVSFFTLAFYVQLVKSGSKIIIVPDEVRSIQEAIDTANDGDTIYVRAGTYHENLVVNKTVLLVGENKDVVNIDGQENGDVIYITANNVCIKGFTIRNSGCSYGNSGILLYYSNCSIILDNNLICCADGIHLIASRANNIAFNLISNNQVGIYFPSILLGTRSVGSSGNILKNNNITNNLIGISLSGASNTTIVNNDVENNHQGISFAGSSNNSIINNNIVNNKEYGLKLLDSSGNTLKRNIIENSSLHVHSSGICLVESSNNTLIGNDLINNKLGISLYDSSSNVITHNNFINNILQAQFLQSWPGTPPLINTCDDGYPSGGNYWSNYDDTDLFSGPNQNETGSDGIGDELYFINPNNKDNYPLMGSMGFYDAGIVITSNFTISEFELNIAQKALSFNVTGDDFMVGFCRVTIPSNLTQTLWQNNYIVLVDGEPIKFKNWTYTADMCIYFAYQHSELEVVIIPEFPSATTLLLTTLTISSSILAKKRLRKKSFFQTEIKKNS